VRLVTDLVDLANLTAVVRALQLPQFTLRRFLPDVQRESIRYKQVKNKRASNAVAPFRAFDAESPIGARPGAETREGRLPPISEKLPLTEGEQLELDALYRNVDTALVDQIYDDAAIEGRRVGGRLEVARGEAISTGFLTIAENGLNLDQIDYGIPAAHRVTASASFAVPTTDAVGQILAWEAQYRDTNGFGPGVSLMPTPVRNNLLLNEGFRDLAAAGAIRSSRITPSQLAQVFSDLQLPPIELYDRKATGVDGVERRIIGEDRFIFLPPTEERLGSTQFGVTREAARLVGARAIDVAEAAGAVAVVYDSEDPVTLWTKVAAIALPVIDAPEGILTADTIP
jgi:hypothetical protein